MESENNKKIEKIKDAVKCFSFFLQNSNSGFPIKGKDYVYFHETGLKGIKKKIPQAFAKKFGKRTEFTEVGRDKKLNTKSRLIKISGDFLNREEEIGKKIALFLDKKTISLLQKVTHKELKKDAEQTSPNKNYPDKLYFLMNKTILFLKHDPQCVHELSISAENLVFLLNPRTRPQKLLKQLSKENKNWFLRETFLRHAIRLSTNNDIGVRDVATCNLVPKNISFICYEYDSL